MVFGLLLLGKILDPSEKNVQTFTSSFQPNFRSANFSLYVFLFYFTVLLTHDVALASGKYTPLL